VDGAVRRIETAYDGQGNPFLVTSYDAATGGSVVNQVRWGYNGLGQLTAEWQAHSGAVNTSTSPKVQYTYSEMPSGANHSRLTAVTYPSGYSVGYSYASGLDASISRLSALTDTSGTLEAYTYLGLGTVVVRAHPQPDLDLTYLKQSGESDGDAGDQYTGLDRFGRVVDQRWVDGSSGTATDRFQYGYDRVGNRLYRDNLVNIAFGEVYTYDGLNQLASFARGTLNGGKTAVTGTPAREQAWDYDAVGNWDGIDVDGVTESRTANAQNEITDIGSLTTPTYDANGNMTQAESGLRFVYDAWNRLVAVKNSAGTTVLKEFGYDGVSRRVSQDDGTTATDLYYTAGWQMLEEQVGGDATQRYVWSPVYVDALVLRDRDTDANGSLDERLWAVQDANWNVTAVVNGAGAVDERFVYDPFGAAAVRDSNLAADADGISDVSWVHLHQGLSYDTLSGLYDNYSRWYSPTLGRFVSHDTLGFAAGDSALYRYIGNNPVSMVDPGGLQPLPPLPVRPSTTQCHRPTVERPNLESFSGLADFLNNRLPPPPPPHGYTPPTGAPPAGTPVTTATPGAPHLYPHRLPGPPGRPGPDVPFFPNLRPENYAIIGPPTGRFDLRQGYNCHAYASDNERVGGPGIPEGAHRIVLGRDPTPLADARRHYEGKGFEMSSNCANEPGLVKIALFGTAAGNLSHTAIEAASGGGWWESKLGEGYLIIHRLMDLEGPDSAYGAVQFCMKKAKR